MKPLVDAQVLDGIVIEPPAAVVADQLPAWETNEMRHLMQHDERAQFAIGQRKEGAASQKDAIKRDITCGMNLTFQEEAIPESERNARIACRIHLKCSGPQRARHDQNIQVHCEDFLYFADRLISGRRGKFPESKMPVQPIVRRCPPEIQSSRRSHRRHQVRLRRMSRTSHKVHMRNHLDLDVRMNIWIHRKVGEQELVDAFDSLLAGFYDSISAFEAKLLELEIMNRLLRLRSALSIWIELLNWSSLLRFDLIQ